MLKGSETLPKSWSVAPRFSCRGLFRAASARWQVADQFTVGSWAAVFSRANGFVPSWSFLNDQQFSFHLFSNIIRHILSYFKPCWPVSLFQVQQEHFEGLTDTRHISFFSTVPWPPGDDASWCAATADGGAGSWESLPPGHSGPKKRVPTGCAEVLFLGQKHGDFSRF